MEIIGRKLYLLWGKTIVAIEKIANTPGNRKMLHIEELGERIKDGPNNSHLLFNIRNALDTPIEEKLGDPVPSDIGAYTIEEYFTNDDYWCMREERKAMRERGE